ncbi:MAG: transposase [Myxococcales bacterium]|nr:transposase [Myxococcales bacterium]
MNVADSFPKNLVEFEEKFATEEACLSYVRRVRWPDGFRCPRAGCAGRRSYPVAGGRREECAECGRQVSVTAGTVFHQTRKPLRLWFRAIWLFVTSKRGVSAKCSAHASTPRRDGGPKAPNSRGCSRSQICSLWERDAQRASLQRGGVLGRSAPNSRWRWATLGAQGP